MVIKNCKTRVFGGEKLFLCRVAIILPLGGSGKFTKCQNEFECDEGSRRLRK